MRRKATSSLLISPLAGLAVLALAAPALAHHSTAAFDMDKTIEITGTVEDFQWTNPHTWTWVDVKGDDGNVTKYGFEGMSPNFLGRRGWTKNTLKPGDHVKIVYAPLKSGEPGGTFLRATLEDGTEMVMLAISPLN